MAEPKTAFPKEALPESVRNYPTQEYEAMSGTFLFTNMLLQANSNILPWGTNVPARDQQLREFWTKETYLASAQASISMRNAAFQWEIKSKSNREEQQLTDMLHGALVNQTFGWEPFMQSFSQDLYGQDNGAFIELIRDESRQAGSPFKGEKAPVIGIGHLDSGRCQRTGNPQIPVIYWDREGQPHKLKWYEVIPFADNPSPIELMYGVGACAVTRVLRMAQLLYSIAVYKDEKIGGRHYKALHFVSGTSKLEIKDAMKRGQEEADSEGNMRFITPAIIASLDPEKPVSVASIDLAALPDGFDLDAEMKWYISALALGYGVDYQDFAPLPGGAIGSSNQSEILHRKSRGKGPALFMQTIENAFRYYGVLPANARFSFIEKDQVEQMQDAELDKANMEMIAIARRANVIDSQRARKISIERGIFTEEELEGIPEDFGNDAFLPKTANENDQMLGQTGANTVGEDAKRVEKSIIDRILGR